MHEVMISYSNKDRHKADAMLEILEQRGIKCWICHRDALTGDNYAGSIVRAIKSASICVLLHSKNSNASNHVLNEVNSAVNHGTTIILVKTDDTDLSENLEYYLGKSHWFYATTPFEEHINSLADVVKTHLERFNARADVTPKNEKVSGEKGYRMKKFNDLLELGYTSSTIAMQLVENDYVNCNGISKPNEGDAKQWEIFLQNHSETFQYLLNDDNEIVGDWSIVALTDETFERAKKGDLLECDLGEGNTEPICFSGIYNGYILAFSLLPEHRNFITYNLLIDSFIEQLEKYAEHGIYFSGWCMNVFGREVEQMIPQLGFKYECDNKIFGKIYYCPFNSIPDKPIYKKYPKLEKYYGKQ